MERRVVIFLVLMLTILLGYGRLMTWLFPPPKKPVAAARDLAGKDAAAKDAASKEAPQKNGKEPAASEETPAAKPALPQPSSDEKESADKPADKSADKPTDEPADAAKMAAAASVPQQYLALGSADPADPYRMLITLTNRGGALMRIELSSDRYRDVEDRSGYLGHVVLDDTLDGKGCVVQLVGPGTPAAIAGLRGESWVREGDEWVKKTGDLIMAVAGQPVIGQKSLVSALSRTRPNDKVNLTVLREGKEITLQAKLGWRPLEVVRPEGKDPLSLLATLYQVDDDRLPEPEETVALGEELKGIDLWNANWEIAEADKEHVVFRRTLTEKGIEVSKTYRLASVPTKGDDAKLREAYHLTFEIEIRNTGDKTRKVAYQLDGPNGLPTEGSWYASKVSPASGVAGMRDFIGSINGRSPWVATCTAIADNKVEKPGSGEPLTFIGVDSLYFSAILIPKTEQPSDLWFARWNPLRVGKPNTTDKRLTNVSCRVISLPNEIAAGSSLKHEYLLFAGPKKPEILQQYGLGEVVYYGWQIFAVVSRPLADILHFIYARIPNYGIAIILLTVLVRGCMFPFSRKQALNAQKMQELQPEIKRIQEKFKKDPEGRARAQQELFRKHNYNPLGGCVVLLFQLPIFIGLYRALSIDVELRDAPLLWESLRWCSNLAAPDMLFSWRAYVPEFVSAGQGIFGLGPYFNILPIATIVLFNYQQQKMMPPPADEQAAMQQKMMKYMMIFMGLLFYKVASGLCIYFIASSLWGVAERRFLPKAAAAPQSPQSRADAKAEAKAQEVRDRKDKK